MAANDILAALIQGATSGGNSRASVGNADLNNFLNTVAENDIYRQIADPIGKAKFDTTGMGLGSQLAVTGGQALVSAFLNQIGKNQESQQLNQVAQILPQLYANPQGTNVPEGVDASAFNQLKLGAIADEFKRGVAERSNTKEFQNSILSELFKSKPDLAMSALGIGNIAPKTPFEQAKEKFGDDVLAREYVKGTSPELQALSDEKGKGGDLQSNLDYVNKQFDDAAGISTISTFYPFGTSNSKLAGIRTGLKTNLQNVYGREINESQQEEVNATLPDWNDTKAQIESKREKALELITKLKGESPEKMYQTSDKDKNLLNGLSETQLRNFASEAKRLGLTKEQAQAKLINILKKQNG